MLRIGSGTLSGAALSRGSRFSGASRDVTDQCRDKRHRAYSQMTPKKAWNCHVTLLPMDCPRAINKQASCQQNRKTPYGDGLIAGSKTNGFLAKDPEA